MALPDTRRLEDLAIEPLSELCKEAYEETAWALENTLKKAVHFGRLLCIAKTKVPHGQWIPWVTETFEDQVSLRNIQRFMQVAESNTTNPSLLEGAKNLDEAMGLIQVKKTSVEVIEVAAEIVAADMPAVEVIEVVATVKPVAAKPASPPKVSPPPPKIATAKVARLLESIVPARRARMEVILREEMKLWPPPAFEALGLILKEVVDEQLLRHGQ